MYSNPQEQFDNMNLKVSQLKTKFKENDPILKAALEELEFYKNRLEKSVGDNRIVIVILLQRKS